MLFILIPLIYLGIASWVSYYTSNSVYKSLRADYNKYARLIQVLIFLLVMAILVSLGLYLLAENFRLER